jgi:hypothetical protein
VLRGRAAINLPPGNEQACGSLEGNAGSYGPCGTLRSDDSSGILRYVRIEFAGREVAPNNELNGLTLRRVLAAERWWTLCKFIADRMMRSSSLAAL